jgi:hypothetical protein
MAFIEGGDDLCAAWDVLVADAEVEGIRGRGQGAAYFSELPQCGGGDACWACAIVALERAVGGQQCGLMSFGGVYSD